MPRVSGGSGGGGGSGNVPDYACSFVELKPQYNVFKPGDYIVKFIAADGSVLSTANVGNDAFDSDAGADGGTGCSSSARGRSRARPR